MTDYKICKTCRMQNRAYCKGCMYNYPNLFVEDKTESDELDATKLFKVTTEYDLCTAMVEGKIRDKLIELGWTPPKKSEKKTIDLSCMVGSDILCEFQEEDALWYISKLTHIRKKQLYRYHESTGDTYRKCRIMENHWHSWQGGECPLPEGLDVLIRCRSGEQLKMVREHGCNWIYDTQYPFPERDVIAFKVLGTAEGWTYEWQKDKDE